MNAKHVLVLCPKSVIDVWDRELKKYMPAIVSLLNKGDSKRKAEHAKIGVSLYDSPHFVVVNYEAAWREPLAATLIAQEWDALVLDECHRIKAHRGKASAFAAKLRAPIRLGLTGTPIPHSPLDVWAQFRAINPTVFPGTFTQFRMRHTRPAARAEYRDKDIISWPGRAGIIERYKFQRLDELHERMYEHAYRVRAADVLDLPEALDEQRRTELEPEARRIYKSLHDNMVAQVKDGAVTAANAAVVIMRLQQLTGGTLRVTDLGDHTEPRLEQVSTAKEQLLTDLLEDIGSEPVVIFGRFHSDLDAITRACQSLGLSSDELSGRRSGLLEWQNGMSQVLVVQQQAGGVGIDLTRARIAIYYSLGYSLADYMQSRARLHRPGQTRNVMYMHLIVSGTIDELVYQALANRADVVASVVDALHG